MDICTTVMLKVGAVSAVSLIALMFVVSYFYRLKVSLSDNFLLVRALEDHKKKIAERGLDSLKKNKDNKSAAVDLFTTADSIKRIDNIIDRLKRLREL